MKPTYSIWLWLYLKLSLNSLCPIWYMYVDNRYFYCYKPAEISLCLFIRSSVIVTCFTMDSILTPQSSHWPAIRNRADSFHSRYNEPRHLWVCRRKELGEWRDLRGRTVCPSHVQGNRGCGAHGATPTCTAILALPQKQHGPCLRIRFNHRSDPYTGAVLQGVLFALPELISLSQLSFLCLVFFPRGAGPAPGSPHWALWLLWKACSPAKGR